MICNPTRIRPLLAAKTVLLNVRYLLLYMVTVAALDPAMTFAQQAASTEEKESQTAEQLELTVETIYGQKEFDAKTVSLKWSDQRPQCYLEWQDAEDVGQDLVEIDALTKDEHVIVRAASLTPPGESMPLSVSGYQWSATGAKLLIYTNTKRVWRRNTRGDYWVLDITNGELKQLGRQAPPSSLMFAKFSPDGNQVAYVWDRELYVENLLDNVIVKVAAATNENQINGTFDWVYEEELSLRDGFRWSPDSRFLAYWQIDTTGVSKFTMINNTDAFYPRTIQFAYPKTGQRNSKCRIGVVPATGGKTRWVPMPGDNRDHYIARMDWIPNSHDLLVQQLNRLQNTNRLFVVNVRKLTAEEIFVERDEAWVNIHDELYWLGKRRKQRFTWISERDGWRHVYLVSGDGENAELVTPGDFDVTELVHVDEVGERLYCMASPDNPTQSYLYSVGLDGQSWQRLTPDSQPGTHRYQINSDGSLAVHSWSELNEPPRTELVRLPSHEVVEELEDNAELREKLAGLELGTAELFRVTIPVNDSASASVELDGWCISPPDFDPNKKYPLLIYVYGEPAGTTVRDRWGGSSFLWHQMLAQQGYFVMSFDNRGTPAPRGRVWRKQVYRKVGIIAPQDQAAAVRQVLRERPYLDSERIGVWGWSGGGSMTLNAMFKYPDLYRTGISVAPVPNQRYYDTIYQERYMGLPNDNVDGYRNGSPLHFAHQLQGNLLLIHGTGDDNCHYQTMELLINELIRHEKQFTMMAYPNRSHSIREGQGTTTHLRRLMTNYLLQHLPTGAD